MASTTFSLRRVYQALGLRSPETTPQVAAGTIVPVVAMGSVSSFAPAAIEARGMTTLAIPPGGSTAGIYIHALSRGGLVIEEIQLLPGEVNGTTESGSASVPQHVFVTPTRPWAGGGNVNVWDYGGTPIVSSVNRIFQDFIGAGADASKVAYIRVNGSAGSDAPPPPSFFSGIYVPPGFFAGVVGPRLVDRHTRLWIRWREFPESLGAA